MSAAGMISVSTVGCEARAKHDVELFRRLLRICRRAEGAILPWAGTICRMPPGAR
jgi:hypothetical protein